MNSSYPSHLEKRVRLRDGAELNLRPIRPDDREREAAFVRNLSTESRYFRFLDSVRELSPAMLSQFTEIDYQRRMALVATVNSPQGELQIAVARYEMDPADPTRCEFAIAVADDWQGRGVGSTLLRELMAVARDAGVKLMQGTVLAANHRMLHLMKTLGFSLMHEAEDPRLMRTEKKL